ncbi:hypothetical protein SPAN111604_05610 [Sphingomonas antarctica]|uniref:hypothetical protein n=1 Tax=Sphingomonas antarctica TaxID=2040274 RepID=UPI0039EBA351
MKTIALVVALTVAAPAWAQSNAPVMAPVETVASPVAVGIAAKLLPNGTYRQMLGGTLKQMIGSMTDGVGNMPIGPILKAAGLDPAIATKINKATLGEIMTIMDPNYAERMRRMTGAMFDAMIPVMETMEPDIRAGLAVSLQNRFSQAQLAELSGFFSTPTGSLYASQQMTLYTDPAVMSRMQAMMPKLMAAMPDIMAQAVKATADLPPAKTAKDLTPADRTRLAELLGVDTKQLDQKK